MKKWFLFISILASILLLNLSDIPDREEVYSSMPEQENIMKENPSTTQQSLEILSKDLKGCTFLTPRRTVQVVQITHHGRIIQQINKMLRLFRLKGEEQSCKLLQINSYRQTIKLSSLLCRRGYHIYALRKIVI